MESLRQKKVSRLVQKELGEVFLREARSLFGGAFITVTLVRISPDLSFAKIYLSLFQVKDVKQLMKNLDEEKRRIRKWLGIRLKNQLRIVPEIAFFVDDTLDFLENIDNLLKKK